MCRNLELEFIGRKISLKKMEQVSERVYLILPDLTKWRRKLDFWTICLYEILKFNFVEDSG